MAILDLTPESGDDPNKSFAEYAKTPEGQGAIQKLSDALNSTGLQKAIGIFSANTSKIFAAQDRLFSAVAAADKLTFALPKTLPLTATKPPWVDAPLGDSEELLRKAKRRMAALESQLEAKNERIAYLEREQSLKQARIDMLEAEVQDYRFWDAFGGQEYPPMQSDWFSDC